MKAMILTLRKLIIIKFSGTILIFCLFSSLSILRAQWQLNGVAVCDTTGDQYVAANGILSDGAGGAYVVWGDNRAGWDIYAQRVDSSGRMLWGKQGKPVCIAPGWQFAPRVAPDGEGGFVVAWHDIRDIRNDPRDVYAQRVDKNGNILWNEEGLQVVHYEQFQGVEDIIMATDSTFIMVWRDDRFFPDSSSINIQKVTKDGLKLWQDDGVRVSNNPGSPKLVSDGMGGALVVWASGGKKLGILVQHIDRDGNRLYEMPGKFASIDNAAWTSSDISVCSDGYGGAYIAWDYSRTDNSYIQHIDSSGTRLWGDTGIQIGLQNVQQRIPRIGLLDSSRVFVLWREAPHTNYNVYDSDGIPLYINPGIPLNNYETGLDFNMVVDNNKNILIANFELSTPQPNKFIIKAHKISKNLQQVWGTQGINITDKEISTDENRGFSVSDGNGGFVVAWDDDRNKYSTEIDIYIQRVYSNGKAAGDTATQVRLPQNNLPKNFDAKVYPNPFNNTVTIEFIIEKSDKIIVNIYNIKGRKIKTITDSTLGSGHHKFIWNGQNRRGKEVSSGLYLVQFTGKKINALRKVLLIR